MIYLLIFGLGIVVDRYVFPIGDMILQSLVNWQNVRASKSQFSIDQIERAGMIESANIQYELALAQNDINNIGYEDDLSYPRV